MDIVVISETWKKAGEYSQNISFTEEISAPYTRQGKPQGGISIYVNPLIKYIKIAEYADEWTQFIALNVAGIIVIGVYISPKTEKARITDLITRWNQLGTKIVAIGDFNARNKKWDKRTFSIGAQLLDECTRRKFKISAPTTPTFRTERGYSTIDLVVTKNQRTSPTKVIKNEQYNGSDHLIITTEFYAQVTKKRRTSRIPVSQRTMEQCIEEAEKELPTKIPEVTKKLGNIKNERDLNEWYRQFKEMALNPWKRARTTTSQTKIRSTNRDLGLLQKYRSKLYRKAKTTGSKATRREYENVNNEYRKLVRKWKTRLKKKQQSRIQDGSPNEIIKIVSRMMKEEQTKTRNKDTNMENIETLKPSEFTSHCNTKNDDGYIPTMQGFKIDEEFQEAVQTAINRAKISKAAGKDELFVEIFQMFPKEFAQVLCDMWKKCGELRCTIGEWQEASLVPIYKKGMKNLPQSYRPITIISHARKIIEAGLAIYINKRIQFDESQMGFRLGTNTTTAILRTTRHCKEKRNNIAILDLKNAYNEVSRKLLMELVEQRLGQNMRNMIATCLQPMELETKDDPLRETAHQRRGVPQGSPLSPTLFNIFMDTYPETLRTNLQGEKDIWTVDLYADDVKLQTRSTEILQRLLNISHQWATQYQMKWSIAKCFAMITDVNDKNVTINNEELTRVEETQYLGISMNCEGITEKRNLQRIDAAISRVGLLRKMNIYHKNLTAKQIKNVCSTFVYSVANYAIQLIPQSSRMNMKWSRMDELVIRLMFGMYSNRYDNKIRKVCRVYTLEETCGIWIWRLEQKWRLRMENDTPNRTYEKQLNDLQEYRTHANLAPMLSHEQLKLRYKLKCANNARKIPVVEEKEEYPIMKHLKGDHSLNAMRWYMGTFPRLPSECIRIHGEKGLEAIQSMKRLMITSEWNKTDEKEIKQTIDTLIEIQPETWSKRKRNNEQHESKKSRKIK